MKHFLDTYALVEIADGNRAYAKYIEDASTSLMNLYELHVQLSRSKRESAANEMFQVLRHLCLDVEDADVVLASNIKRSESKRKFSYIDALGYAMAQNRAIPFVTGDKAFRDLEGVHFLPGKAVGKT